MDQERLFTQLEQRYISKREMLSRIPLGTQPDALWQELLNRRRSRATILPICNYLGKPYWYLVTDKMISASEKIVEALLENETDFDPYADPPVVATLEEVFYTSYIDGSNITIQEAMTFLQSDQPPRDIEEQMIANNRNAGSYASGNLYRMVDEVYLQELAFILTDGIEGGGQGFRTEDWIEIPSMRQEIYRLPPAASIPYRINELLSFLEDIKNHPLIKAAVAQAWMMVVRPFPEGNERLGRILSTVILLRAGYTFFSDISLSALIARKSYGYYEAISNIIRDENDGDLTYFLEYYLEVLSRAVDERRLRIEMKNSDVLKAEAKIAKTALFQELMASEASTTPANFQVAEMSKEAESVDDVSDNSGECIPEEGGVINEVGLARLCDELYRTVARGDGVLSKCAKLLLKYIHEGRYSFTTADLERDIPVTAVQSWKLSTTLKDKGFIVPAGKSGKHVLYAIQTTLPALTEEDYSPEILKEIQSLIQSSTSPKDKRMGTVLSGCLPKGIVTASDYEWAGQEGRLSPDMSLAQQMGLVEKIDTSVYRIMREKKPGLPKLRRSQKEAVTEIYGAFGTDAFSREMIIATLDYSSPKVSATLHELMLLRIVDCRKEDVLLYQLLVNPKEYPECFVEGH